jgi:hypothetical protein
MVDEDLPFGREGGRKSWYLSLTQDEDLLKTLGPVKGIPKKGKTLLLFEDDVVALVQHLVLADLVDMDEQGRIVNGPAREWEELRAMKQARRKRKRQAKRSRELRAVAQHSHGRPGDGSSDTARPVVQVEPSPISSSWQTQGAAERTPENRTTRGPAQ